MSTSTPIQLHGDDGNSLSSGERTVVIDFEAACWGPIEWDAAFFPDDAVMEVWPNIDRRMLAEVRTVVSATVSIYCWRNLAVRGPDEIMMSHAQHHLARVLAR